MEYKFVWALLVLILVFPFFWPGYGQNLVGMCLGGVIFGVCRDYLKIIICKIQLKKICERCMSNVIHGTDKTIQKCCVILLCAIPILIYVYAISLYVICLACLAPLSWIFWIIYMHLKHKYHENIYLRVMSFVSWIKRTYNRILESTITKTIFYFGRGVFAYTTCDGYVKLLIVLSTCTNFYLSDSMGVRNCQTNVQLWKNMDNLIGSRTQLIRFVHEFNIVNHPDLQSLSADRDKNLMKNLVTGVLLIAKKEVVDAKLFFDIQNNNIEISANLISWIPQLEYFAKILPCLPYLICCGKFRQSMTYLYIGVMIYYSFMYCLLLIIRYFEHGLFGVIFHWITCCHVLVLACMWIYYLSWVDKPEPESQKLEHGTSQTHPTQKRSARCRSPAAHRAP